MKENLKGTNLHAAKLYIVQLHLGAYFISEFIQSRINWSVQLKSLCSSKQSSCFNELSEVQYRNIQSVLI